MTKSVFLSHSSQDADFARLLAGEIEGAFVANVEVFLSSRSDAIPSGTDWQTHIIEKLDRADSLVILITRSAENSAWIGFELGYFWKKTDGKRIHALFHPTASLPSPLNTLQGKRVSDSSDLQSFFDSLASDIAEPRTSPNLLKLVENAATLSIKPPERSLANFERLLDQAEWEKVFINGNIWICVEDVLFQIGCDWEVDEENYKEEWTERFPTPHPSRTFPVYLTIAGLQIEKFIFVALDGARYFVPLPDINRMGTSRFAWTRSSLKFKVAQKISHFGSYAPSFEDFAEITGIEIL